MTTDHAEAARRRAARRRHLQQRQTLVFGVLITALVAVGVLAAAMWGNMIPSPFTRPFSAPAPTAGPAPTTPCPPADALPAPFPEITANVYNATDQSGLAGRTAGGLAQYGIVISEEGNYGGAFEGVANVVAGPSGLRAAHTVAALLPDASVSLDDRDDETVDVVVGGSLSEVPPPETSTLDMESPLPVPPGCTPADVPTDTQDVPAED